MVVEASLNVGLRPEKRFMITIETRQINIITSDRPKASPSIYMNIRVINNIVAHCNFKLKTVTDIVWYFGKFAYLLSCRESYEKD